MIRRISKHCDLKDIIKSCPSGVIDDIYAIEYYIQGYNTVIQANFTKKETMLEVIIPSTDLETLPNGILMRRAFYKVLDASYPDGYYNLEFEDNMNVWIGENESEEPVIPEYVTEEELSSTLSSYATQSWVYGRGYATESFVSGQIGSVKNWVVSQAFLTSASLSNYITESTIESLGFATESWVQGQGYLTSHQDLSSYATQSWVQQQGYLTSHQDLSSYATQSWVQGQGYITIGEIPSGLATQSWVQSQGYLTSIPSEYATQSWVSSQQFATKSWVQSQGYLTEHQDLSSYATQSWVQSQGYLNYSSIANYATKDWVSSQQFVTQSWVQSQGYYTSSSTIPASIIGDDLESRVHDIEIGATEIPGYVTNEVIGSYATQSWVQNQGYLTQHQDLSSYATQSWATDQFLEENKVWCGTAAQWNNLTAEEKASYKIALVTA